MNFFAWFSTSAAKSFGATIAKYYIDRIPYEAGLTEKQFASKSKHVLTGMERQISAFQKTGKVNFYQLAQLGNAFKWALKDAGYEDQYVDRLTTWLVAKFR